MSRPMNWDPFETSLHQPTSVYLPADRIYELFYFFDRDANVRSAFGLKMDALLAGSIIFQRKNETLDPLASRWYSAVYSQLCREITRSIWSCGFAAVVVTPHSVYTGQPMVLDLLQCEVEYRLSVQNFPEFRFFSLAADHGSDQLDRKPIPGVQVYYQSDLLPQIINNRQVQFRSPLASLLPDQILEDKLRFAQSVVTERMLKPTIIVSNPIPKTDTNNLGSGLPTAGQTLHGNGDSGPMANASEVEADQDRYQQLQQRNVTLDLCQQLNINNVQDLQSVNFRKIANAMQNMGPPVQQLFLAQGKEMAGQMTIESPGELMMQVMQARTERVWTVLGVPPALLTQKSAFGSSQQVSESALTIFENGQRQLKEMLLRFLHMIYQSVYESHHHIKYMSKQPSGKKFSIAELNAAAAIDISLPGMPSELTITELYQMGVLKYEYYTEYLSNRHGLPKWAFEPKALIDVEDLALGREKPEDSTASAKPKAKKKKTKSSSK